MVVEAVDPAALGRWWAAALRWTVVNDDPNEFEIQETPNHFPGILFLQTGTEKPSKNRLHLDFRPDDQDSEVERLISLGARRIDVGQGDAPWVVLADPEGNEFCVLGVSPPDDGASGDR